MSEAVGHYFDSREVTNFLLVLQEATRARPLKEGGIYLPPVNAVKVEANYHHLIFGQRGSGKSTLLRKLQDDNAEKGRVAAWIDQEVFGSLSFPDVLVSSVEALFREIRSTIETRERKVRDAKPLLKRLMHRMPSDVRKLSESLRTAEMNMRSIKFAPLESSIEWTESHGQSASFGVIAKVSVQSIGVSAEGNNAADSRVESRQVVLTSKREYLERSLPDYRNLLHAAAEVTEGGAIFVDDLYHLNQDDQPHVLGYMHRLVKDTGYWLKIGSIRYLTRAYSGEGRPIGIQAGNDAHLIALDDGMQRLRASSRWLEEILRELAPRADVDIDRLFSQGALERLALASGCIARDYLTIAGAAIETARNRPASTKAGTHRVMVEDVNRAAAVLAPAKLDDLQKDAPELATEVQYLISELTAFCRGTKRAYFLVDSADRALGDKMESLRHLRFVHLLERSETVKDDSNRRYDVWLLDLSQLAANRATQRMDFDGWVDREKRRNRTLVFGRRE